MPIDQSSTYEEIIEFIESHRNTSRFQGTIAQTINNFTFWSSIYDEGDPRLLQLLDMRKRIYDVYSNEYDEYVEHDSVNHKDFENAKRSFRKE